MLPSTNGTQRNPRPATIILGSSNTDHNKLNIKFGAYAKLYIGTTNIKKTENGRDNQTKTIKRMGRILFCVLSYQERAPQFHMNRTTYQLSSNIEGKQAVH